MAMSSEGFSNPCDSAGYPVECERCGAQARHRRTIERRDRSGMSWLMTANGPSWPADLSVTELLCQDCIKDMGQQRRPVDDVLGWSCSKA